MTDGITLYGSSDSGNCLKCKWVAERLDVPLRWIETNAFTGETRTPEFLAINPAGQVPVAILADGRMLAQSNAIMLHLAERSELTPNDAYDRAKMFEWLFWEQYSHEPYVAVCRFHMVYLSQPKDAREAWRVERGEAALDLMNRSLADREWLAGETMTVADIVLLPYTRLAHEGGFDLSSRPNLRGWVRRCEQELGLGPAADA